MVNTYDTVINFLKKYEYFADLALSGDYTNLVYKHSNNEKYGDYDENYINRKRLVAVMTTIRPDVICEEVVNTLFLAETESCHYSSFGGYDTVLETLTAMLWEYNDDGRYDKAFENAKNANFDCICGYEAEKNAYSYQVGTDFINEMSDIDGIEYLFYYLGIEDELTPYLDMIERKYYDDKNHLSKIRTINNQLGRKNHNYRFYQLELKEALKNNDSWKIAVVFQNLIDILINTDKAKAYELFKKAVPYLFLDKEWLECNLGRDYIIFAADFINNISSCRENLWREWKEYIITANEHIFNGNERKVLLDAAENMNDYDAVKRIKKIQMRKSPAELIVTIEEIVDISFYPGICKAYFIDVNGKKHIFTDKIPVFTEESNPDIQSEGELRCEIVEEKEDTVIINTEIPDDVEDQNGEYTFEVCKSLIKYVIV